MWDYEGTFNCSFRIETCLSEKGGTYFQKKFKRLSEFYAPEW